MKKRTLVIAIAIVFLAIILSLASYMVILGNRSQGAKSPLWTYHSEGTINSISISENGSYIAAGVGFNLTSGAVLLFDRSGNLLWEHQTNRIIGDVTVSGDGSRILADGYQLSPGPARTYENAEVYTLDSKGNLLWSRNSGYAPLYGTMSTDGSRIAVAGSNSVALLTWEGKILWNYSAQSPAVAISQNGSRVFIGSNGITMLGSDGNRIWTYRKVSLASGNPVPLTPAGYLIPAGNSTSGVNGTIFLLTSQGGLLWKHHVDSAVLSAAILPNGSSVGYVTNWNAIFYDRGGTLLANYTTDGESHLLPTRNGLFLLGGGDSHNLVLFDARGHLIWRDPLGGVLTEAVSSEGAFAAASSGTGGQGGQGFPSTLYFFSTTRNGTS